MKTYELTYIISPEVGSEEVETKAREIDSAIQGKEGIILSHTNPVAKTLSYQIEKKSSGFFAILEFQLEPEKLSELKEMVAKDKKIIRHMLLVKRPARQRKERRSRTKITPISEIEPKTEIESVKEEKPAAVKTAVSREKVELKDIEEKLEEILGD